MLGLRLIIASGALWAAAGITAGILRSSQETAPVRLADEPEPVLTEILHKADRLPLVPAAAITDRWLDAPAERSDELQLAPAPQVASRALRALRATPHLPRNVCTRHGMRKVITRGGRSWRCRR